MSRGTRGTCDKDTGSAPVMIVHDAGLADGVSAKFRLLTKVLLGQVRNQIRVRAHPPYPVGAAFMVYCARKEKTNVSPLYATLCDRKFVCDPGISNLQRKSGVSDYQRVLPRSVYDRASSQSQTSLSLLPWYYHRRHSWQLHGLWSAKRERRDFWALYIYVSID